MNWLNNEEVLENRNKGRTRSEKVEIPLWQFFVRYFDQYVKIINHNVFGKGEKKKLLKNIKAMSGLDMYWALERRIQPDVVPNC